MDVVSNKRGFVITIRARLIIGFLTLSVPLLLLILLLPQKVTHIVSLSHEINKDNLTQIADTEVYQTQDIIDHWIMTNDPQDKIRFESAWAEINKIREKWDADIVTLGNQKILSQWKKIQQLYGPYYQAQLIVLNTPRKPGDVAHLHEALFKLNALKDTLVNLFDGVYAPEYGRRIGGLYHELIEHISKNNSKIDEQLNALRLSSYWLLILAVFLTIVVPIVTQHAISGPIDNAINTAERIAAGERDVAIHIKSADKLGKLLLSLKTMQEAIRKNEEILRFKEEESRELFEQLINSSKKFQRHSSKVAAGELRERLEIEKEDLLHDLGNDLNLMTDGLASITKKITKVSNDIVIMVETVLTSAKEQEEGITSQASAISEISASLKEIDKSSKRTMAKAHMLREVAKNTYEQGKLGAESIAQSIEGIKAAEEKMKLIAQTILDLSTHTQQIGDITAVVNTLAQQSKMLALNAAIEASKAGEAGKGFSVVATEVRNLAEQSEQSTIQVQKILEDIRRTTEKAVTVTEEGAKTLASETKLIEKAGEVFHDLSKMINKASLSSQHIETAIHQGAVGIEQIVISMNEINRTTATFSSGIKELMAFIHNLDEIAQHLKDDVNIYKV